MFFQVLVRRLFVLSRSRKEKRLWIITTALCTDIYASSFAAMSLKPKYSFINSKLNLVFSICLYWRMDSSKNLLWVLWRWYCESEALPLRSLLAKSISLRNTQENVAACVCCYTFSSVACILSPYGAWLVWRLHLNLQSSASSIIHYFRGLHKFLDRLEKWTPFLKIITLIILNSD